MRLSRYFLPILRETPKEAEIVSHRLMLRAGMMRQEAAGHLCLPAARAAGAEEDRADRARGAEPRRRHRTADADHPVGRSLAESGRYEAYGKEMLRIEDRHEREMLYGPTNEEMITEIFRAYVRSYKDLPLNLYHIQWKFRDEVRPRFGLMRGREFLMKDAYSFDVDQAGARHSYNKMFVAYLRTFARMGLKSIPMRAESGPIGGDLSHEFIILAETGESEVFCHNDYLDFAGAGCRRGFRRRGRSAIHRRQMDLALCRDVGQARRRGLRRRLPADKQVSARGIEVGHIFYFGTKYSEPMKAVVSGPDGVEQPVHMGSYGIGPSRLVAAIIEASHDDAGINWPEAVAPFKVGDPQPQAGRQRDRRGLRKPLPRSDRRRGSTCSIDDLDQRPGAKFATADLIGVPWQVVIGPKGLAAGKFEVKKRADGSRENLSPAATHRSCCRDEAVRFSNGACRRSWLESARIG